MAKYQTKKVTTGQQAAPRPPAADLPQSDDRKALAAILRVMRTYGYDLPDRRGMSRRGLVQYRDVNAGEEQLKQGGLTLANEKIASIARSMVREGQFDDPELAKLVSTLAANLEAAKPVAALLRKLKAAEGLQTRGTVEPGVGKKPIDTPQGRRYVPSTPKSREQLEKEIAEPLRSLAGRQFVVVTPDDKQFPISLKAADIAEIRRLVVANPQVTGFYQSAKTRPSGETYDPVVRTEMFDRNMRQAVLRQLLKRMRASGQYPKGSTIMELDTDTKLGTTLYKRGKVNVTPGTSTPSGKARVSSTLADVYEESMSNRDEFGRVRQGRPTVGKTADLRTPQKPFSYDLPGEVDLVVEDGRTLFSYPGAKKPGTIEEVVAYYKAKSAASPDNLDLLESALKVQNVKSTMDFIRTDPNAADIAIDRAGSRKPSTFERQSEQDEQRAQDRRAFRQTLREDVAPKDRGSFERRKTAEEADINRAGIPGRGPKLATKSQMGKLTRVVQSYEKYMRSQGQDERTIQKTLNGILGGVESYKIDAESIPGQKGEFERYTRYTLPNFPGKGGKAILASKSDAPLKAARVGVATRKDVSAAIKKITDLEITARLDAGATRDELIDAGFDTTTYRGGKRPFNAATEKSLIPGAFDRKGRGIIPATEKELGTQLRTKVENDVKALLKSEAGASGPELYNKLVRLMYSYRRSQRMSPSSFMRIAKTVDPKIEELVSGQARSAEAARIKGGRSEAYVRSEIGDVGATAPRMSGSELDVNNMLAGKSRKQRRDLALGILAEMFPQLEGTAPQGLGVEIKVPPNLRGTRSAEDIIAGAERRGRAATTREQQRYAQAKQSRVADALRQLENLSSPVMRRAAQTRRRQETGSDLLRQLRAHLESIGASSEFRPRRTAKELA